MSAEDILGLSRLYMRQHAPYFTRVLLSLRPVPETRVKTLGVTPGLILYYNPEYIEKLDEKGGGSRLWHEVQHVLRRSFDRLVGVDQRLANECEDLAINSSGLHNPAWEFSDGLLPAKYGLPNDLTAEEYYALIPPGGFQQGGENGGPGCGQCGGIAGNSENEELEAELDQQYGRSQAEVGTIKEQTAQDIIRHEKTRGKIPGGWGEWATALLTPPVIPWQVYFQNTVRSIASNAAYGDSDYSISRPSRRVYAMPPGPFRPGLIGEEVEFAIILDTSGSMDLEKNIRPVLREARGAIMASGADSAWFLQCDAMLSTEIVRVRSRDLLEVDVRGRGGTDFRPAIEAVMKLRPKPNIVIYYTDGYGPAPAEKPQGMEFVWCLVGQQTQVPATWGQVVRVPN